jgi:hypothetical protein
MTPVKTLLFIFLVSMLLLCLASACNQPVEVTQSKTTLTVDGPTVDITTRAGELFNGSGFKSKVPTFFNLGNLDNSTYVILLGAAQTTHKPIHYRPIGMYSIEVDSIPLSFILGKPLQEEFITFESDSYNNWSLNEVQYKSLIELWFKTNCELISCGNGYWDSELKALRILENLDNTKTK